MFFISFYPYGLCPNKLRELVILPGSSVLLHHVKLKLRQANTPKFISFLVNFTISLLPEFYLMRGMENAGRKIQNFTNDKQFITKSGGGGEGTL